MWTVLLLLLQRQQQQQQQVLAAERVAWPASEAIPRRWEVELAAAAASRPSAVTTA